MFDRRRFLGAVGVGASGSLVSGRMRILAGWAEALENKGRALAEDEDRPEYHYIAPKAWMNDPNGPIWWKGHYHLFYQWSPNSAAGGPPHWGHAVSKDLVHWRHLPIALAPTKGGWDKDGCWTGSAVARGGVVSAIYTGVQDLGGAATTAADGCNGRCLPRQRTRACCAGTKSRNRC